MPSRPPVLRPVGLSERREIDRERGSAAARGYDRAWQRVRASVLNHEPLCRFCFEAGRLTAATVVDHIVRVRERPDLRLVLSNLRPLCKPCHDAHTARTTGSSAAGPAGGPGGRPAAPAGAGRGPG